MHKGISLFEKKRKLCHQDLFRAPPDETITGFLVVAIFSINGQSFISELAILIIGRQFPDKVQQIPHQKELTLECTPN